MSSTCSSTSSTSSLDSFPEAQHQRQQRIISLQVQQEQLQQQQYQQLQQQLEPQNTPNLSHHYPSTQASAKAVHWREPENVGSSSHDKATKHSHASLPQHLRVKQEDSTSSEQQQTQRDSERYQIDTLLHNLSLSSLQGRLLMINLSRRGLQWQDAYAVREAMQRNPDLSVLKLSYNELGDKGTAIIASGFLMPSSQSQKHESLTVLDLGFNAMGDAGCATLSLHAVAGNYKLDTLYLSGNHFQQKGAMAVAGAILHGCNLSELHLSVNKIGIVGVQALARAIAEREAIVAREATCMPSGHHNQHQPLWKTMKKLHLVGIDMGHEGFVTLSSMLLTNFSITTLCLSNNGVDDNCMALLAQSLSRNKSVPLEIIRLSFNEITCAGVECFMNAVWGSQVLKEIRLDNNKLRDRGAQLAAVALTSIPFTTIDLSFNKITNVGIKALMKSLSENSSLIYLGLSGIIIDPNASKALSYGLAYNSTLKYLHVDNCQIGYAAQRHIVAGVVSNRMAALRVLTGFAIGPIGVTLRLPKPLEGWTNDQCLSFTRLMWKVWRQGNGFGKLNDTNAIKTCTHELLVLKRMGPAPPSDVVKASQMAFQLIGGVNGAQALNTEDHQKAISETSPLVNSNDAMLERSVSGTLRVPAIAQEDIKPYIEGVNRTSTRRVLQPLSPPVDPEQRNRNLHWLRKHFQSLHQVGQMPFNEADLWQLHQYFFSPLVPTNQSEDNGKMSSTSSAETTKTALSSADSRRSPVPPSVLSNASLSFLRSGSVTGLLQARANVAPDNAAPSRGTSGGGGGGLNRALSFQALFDSPAVSSVYSVSTTSTRRRSLGTMEENDDNDSTSSEEQPATKRARNFRPRISYYPRIRELLESLGTKRSQQQILALLRQLKFVEGIMFDGRDVYSPDAQQVHKASEPTPADVEMIILDLL